MHWPKLDFGRAPLTDNCSKRFSISDQPSFPTFLVMNWRPLRARAAPDLLRSSLLNRLEEVEVMRRSSWETWRRRKESWEPSEEGRCRSRRLARMEVSRSPPLMFWTETESSRTSSVISTYSSFLNLALFLLLFLFPTNGPLGGPLDGPLNGPLKPTRPLRTLSVSDEA